MDNALLYPMTFMVCYILGLGVSNFLVRYGAIKRREVRVSHFKTYDKEMPERLIVWGRHFDNQFQLPLLFLITCLVHMQLGGVNLLTLGLAWFFVFARILHSWAHLGANRPAQRAMFYALGWLAVVALWMMVLVKALN